MDCQFQFGIGHLIHPCCTHSELVTCWHIEGISDLFVTRIFLLQTLHVCLCYFFFRGRRKWYQWREQGRGSGCLCQPACYGVCPKRAGQFSSELECHSVATHPGAFCRWDTKILNGEFISGLFYFYKDNNKTWKLYGITCMTSFTAVAENPMSNKLLCLQNEFLPLLTA